MGRKGRKNCLVAGTTSEPSSRVATKVLASGPGVSMTLRQKMPRTARRRYWAS